jgi:transcriptional regulator with XRE-family HTH domain
MSTELDDEELSSAGVPELTPLGKRIEFLRLERRMSKRVLAQRAGTSRQQLWRVMTGKSELTSSLCARLSEVLETDSRLLRDATLEANGHAADGPPANGSAADRRLSFVRFEPAPGNGRFPRSGSVFVRRLDPAAQDERTERSERTDGAVGASPDAHLCQTLEDYIAGPNGLERTFATLPATDDGRRLKRVLLDAIEDIAIARSLKLPQAIFDLRRTVVNDDA